jgi:8-oxo-dGTP pyrophosphatase MutT (NUDIX family)
MENVEREAARLLVQTPEHRTLLLRLVPGFRDPFWVTPGGGRHDGESFEEAGARELAEEVGRGDLAIGPWLWTRRVEFTWEDRRIRQIERTYLVSVPEPFDAVTVEPDVEPIAGARWFTPEELATLDEVVYPVDLATLLARFVREGPPATPIDLGAYVEE